MAIDYQERIPNNVDLSSGSSIAASIKARPHGKKFPANTAACCDA